MGIRIQHSVILPRYSTKMLCNYYPTQLFQNLDKNPPEVQTTRLYITGSYDRYLDWANYDQSVHKQAVNKDVCHFMVIYPKDVKTGSIFTLSIDLSQTPFLTHKINSDHIYLHNREDKVLC